MLRKSIWRGALLAAVLLLAPNPARADYGAAGYAPPSVQLPLPVGSTRPEDGGPFVGLTYVMYRLNNPLESQPVAYSGFIDNTGQLPFSFSQPNTFFGQRREVLNVNQVAGPGSYQPGFRIDLGYQFADESTLTLSWTFVTTYQVGAAATNSVRPFDQPIPADLADTFLTAFVFNFPPEYGGPAQTVNTQAVDFQIYGIWNGATIMTLQQQTRYQRWELLYRQPVYQTEDYRVSSVCGPRFTWIWDGFTWWTTKYDANGVDSPSNTAIYYNNVSNRMYGAVVGCDQEWYCGHGLALNLRTNAALYMNIAREKAKYKRGVRFAPPQRKRSRTDYSVVPELEANLGVTWYAYEGIEIRAGYEFAGFFNTFGSESPIDFNYGRINPKYEKHFRFLDGFDVGIAFRF